MLSEDPGRTLTGLRNLIVFGRAVTNVLQNLRSVESDFDEWYGPFVEEMRADALMRYFYKLRSDILKKGILPTSTTLHIHDFKFSRDLERIGPPPPGAKNFFMGDQTGGSGWEVELPDGTVEKYYVDVPGDIATSRVDLANAPSSHRGSDLSDTSIPVLARLYFNYLSELVRDAREHFEPDSKGRQ